jgi:YidC/Oxa1 family membrane protein insertase
MEINRFKQLKEQDKSKALRKALPTEGVQALDSASGSDEDSDEETNDKVNPKFQLL